MHQLNRISVSVLLEAAFSRGGGGLVLMSRAGPIQASSCTASTVSQNTRFFNYWIRTHTPKWGQGVFFTDGCGSLANCCEAEARRGRTLAVAVHEGQIGQRRGEDTKSFVWSWFRGKSILNVTPVSRLRSSLAPLHLCKRRLRQVIVSLLSVN